MLKHTVTYEDFNGVERKEDLYFNLSKKEINDFGLDGYTDQVEKVQKQVESGSYNTNELIDLYMKLILRAYGLKSEDGSRFIKTEEMTNNFTQSCAFEALTDKLLEDENFANEFILGILPKNLAEKAAEKINEK